MKRRRFTCILLSAVLVISLAVPVLAGRADMAAESGISYENTGEPGGVEVTGYASGAQHLEELYIPSVFQDETEDDPVKVDGIKDGAYSGDSALKALTVADGIQTIGASAFADCRNLESVILPDSVTSIGESAFENCVKLTDIDMPAHLESISSGLFRGCEALSRIVLPDGVESIGDEAFSGCTSLVSVSIPESVTRIGSDVFSDTALKSIRYGGTKEQWSTLTENCGAIPENILIACSDGLAGEAEAKSFEALIEQSGTEEYWIDSDGRFRGVAISTANERTTAATIEKKLDAPNDVIIGAVDSDDQPLGADDAIGTGCRLIMSAASDPEIRFDDVVVVTNDDILGSGELSLAQIAAYGAALRKSWAGESLEEPFASALAHHDMRLSLALTVMLTKRYEEEGIRPTGAEQRTFVLSGPSAPVHPGEIISISIDTTAECAYADIKTVGLEVQSVGGTLLSDTQHVLLLKDLDGRAANYTCRITAQAGETVSFELSAGAGYAGGKEFAAQGTQWSATVEDRVLATKQVQIAGPDNVETDRTVSVTIGYDEQLGIEGCSAAISVSGLEFLECNGTLSDESNLVLASALGGNTATYTYRVTAQVGEIVSLSVSNMTYTDGKKDLPGLNSEWKAAVWPAATTGVRIDCAQQVVSGDNVYITCQPIGSGVFGIVHTEGLQFNSVFSRSLKDTASGGPSNENLCLAFQYEPVIYMYTVTAAPGETVSFSLTRCVATDGSKDYGIPDAVWSAPVQSAQRSAASGYSSWDPAGDAGWAVPSAYEVESGGTVGINLQTKEGELRYSIKPTPLSNAAYKPLDVQSDQLLSGAKGAVHSGTVSGQLGDGVNLVLEGTWSAPGRVQSIRRDLGNIIITGNAPDTPTDPGDSSHDSSSGTEATPSASPSPSSDAKPSDNQQSSASATPSETPSSSPSASATASTEPTRTPAPVNSPEASATARPQPTVSSGGTSPTANPLAITSLGKVMRGEYTIKDGYLRGQQPQDRFKRVSVNDLTSSMDLPKNYSLLVFDNKGGRRMANDALGTGCQVILSRSEGLRMDSAIAVVQGDVLGTGEIGLSQLVRMAAHVSSKKLLADAYLYAGDWNNDGNVTISDLTREASELRKARVQ